jgi:hypothetical protein
VCAVDAFCFAYCLAGGRFNSFFFFSIVLLFEKPSIGLRFIASVVFSWPSVPDCRSLLRISVRQTHTTAFFSPFHFSIFFSFLDFFFISQFPRPRVKSSAPLGSAAEALSPHTPRVRGLQPAHFGSAAELYAARNRIFGTAVPVFDDDGVTPLRTGARFLTRATIGHTIASCVEGRRGFLNLKL